MHKYLYVNGCSYVTGEDLDNPIEERWSRKLADMMGSTEINQAENGGSNKRILRVTFDWLVENRDKWKDTLVIIGWTQFTRTEFYNDGLDEWFQQDYQDVDSDFANWTITEAGHFVRNPDIPKNTFWGTYVKHFFNFGVEYQEGIKMMVYLQSFFENNDIDYLFFNSLNIQNWLFSNELSNKYDDLLNQTTNLDITFEDFSKQGMTRGYHPNKEYQLKWSKYLKEIIDEIIC